VSDSAPGYRRIYRVVRRIPSGKVATYGQIAELAGIPRQPRRVGYALHALPRGSDVPWQRVINAKGEVSRRSTPGCEGVQRAALESEGVVFDARGRVDLARYQWRPRWRPGGKVGLDRQVVMSLTRTRG
jgi:methylated-DNA-protein-cysteine methyltransferase-like protein